MHQRMNATDKKRRIAIIIVFTLMVGVGAVLIGLGLPWLEESSQKVDSDRALNYIIVTIMVTLLSVVPLGIFILWLGIKTFRYARVPPQLARFQRSGSDVPDEKARGFGLFIIALAGVMIVAALIGGLYLPYKFHKTFSEAAVIVNQSKGTDSAPPPE